MGRPLYEKYGFVKMEDEMELIGDKLFGKHEHCYVEKKFKGNQRADKK